MGHFGIVGYLMLKLPLIISQLLPAAALAGVLLSFALLNRSGEVLAFQQLGFSRLEIAVPVLIVAIGISMFDFVFSESIVPMTTRKSRYVYTVEIRKREQKAVLADRNIWMRVRDGFLSVDSYDAKRQMLQGITVLHVGPDHKITDIGQIREAEWNGSSWQMSNPKMYQVAADGAVSPAQGSLVRIEATPGDFSIVRQDPEEFSLTELNAYIHNLRRKGLDPGGYLVDRDLKYAMPLSCFIMAALGTALSLDPLPRKLSLGRSFAIGIGLGAAYWLVMGISASFGRSGLLPAGVAAWIPNFLFATLALAGFLRGEQH